MVTTPSIEVTEGDDVTLLCYAAGDLLPDWKWALDLTYRIPAGPRDQGGSNQGIFIIPNVQSLHQRRYWCIGTSVQVNPSLGKRELTDMTFLDLIVNCEFFFCVICNITITLFLPTSLYLHMPDMIYS